jgi:DNA modification methylase
MLDLKMIHYDKVLLGNNLDLLKRLPDNCIDSVVTDPPYGISFMNKAWDYDVPTVELWREVLRVLKPGGHALVACGTRTQHRMAVNLEDAGFEIRDIVAWVYGSGFPKSMDISKAIDKHLGAEREVVGDSTDRRNDGTTYGLGLSGKLTSNEPSTDEAKQWQGWGTALKPAMELFTLCRKPIKGTVAENVLRYGVGGLNIDGCRVGTEHFTQEDGSYDNGNNVAFGNVKRTPKEYDGRFPANFIHDGSDEVVALFPNENDESASRFFKQCEYGDDDKWSFNVNGVEKDSRVPQATKESTVQKNAITSQERLIAHYAKFVGNLSDKCATDFARQLVEISDLASKKQESKVIQDFINYAPNCILFHNLVQFVGELANIDTTPIIADLLKLFGYVNLAITSYTQETKKSDWQRFIYTPKSSQSERNDGLYGFEEASPHGKGNGLDRVCEFCGASQLTPEECTCETKSWIAKTRKNIHPTVKPLDLMRYLCRMITPKGGVVLDPFLGSGTTAIAAKQEKMHYIGMEIEPKYVAIAEARIKAAIVEYDIFDFMESGEQPCSP